MNRKQISAVIRLKKALDACHAAGLIGGVFDCKFCAWPVGSVHPGDVPRSDYFAYIRRIGAIIDTRMNLDGGAGV